MMAGDKVANHLGQLGFVGQGQAVVHVLDDGPGTLLRGKARMIVDAFRLVLNEAHRIFHLADVVVERAHPHKHGVRTDRFGRIFSQVGHLQRMLESARRLLLQILEQFVVGVGKIPQAGIGHKTENLLEKEDEGIEHDRQDRVDAQEEEVGGLEGVRQAARSELEGEADQRDRQEDEQHVQELEPAPVEETVREQRDRAGRQVDEEEFHAIFRNHEQRQDRYGIDRPGQVIVEEGAHVQRQHGKGEEIEQPLVHPEKDGRGSKADEQHQHQENQPPQILQQTPFDEEQHEKEECQQGDDNQHVAGHQSIRGAGIAIAHLVFRLVGIQDLADVARDDLPFRYDELAGIDHALGGRDVVDGFPVDQLRGVLVVEKVRHNEGFQVEQPGDGIDVDVRIVEDQVGTQDVLDTGQVVHIGGRRLGNPFVTLDEDHFVGLCTVAEIRDDAPFIGLAQVGVHLAGQFPVELQFDGLVAELLELGRRDRRVVAVVIHGLGSPFFLLLQHLRLGLEDREVDGRDQRLIDPGTAFLVLVLELSLARIKEQHQDGQHDKTDISPIIFHNFAKTVQLVKVRKISGI